MDLFGYNINFTTMPYLNVIIIFTIIFLLISFILFEGFGGNITNEFL